MRATAAANHWFSPKCARAFWAQQDLPPYREVLAETIARADPRPGERWLDLGCGGGSLTRALWERSGGTVAEVVGLDAAAANEARYASLRRHLAPSPGDRVRFFAHDFSAGLQPFADGAFDHVVSGLAICYAESFSEAAGRWTDEAYDRVLSEVCRVLRPGGRFVFSVLVPEPSWTRVSLSALRGAIAARRPLKYLLRCWRMNRYGGWLKREARGGRFQYLPHETVTGKLHAAGFTAVSHATSYAGQAYVFRAVKAGK